MQTSFSIEVSSQQAEAFAALCLSCHVAHCSLGSRERLHRLWAGRICRTCFQVGSVITGPAESLTLWNSAFILLSFFKHTVSFSLPDGGHALRHTDHQVTGGKAGLAVTLCAHRCAHAHTWHSDHVSNWKAKMPTVDDHSSGIYQWKLENQRTTFPCFSRENGVNL